MEAQVQVEAGLGRLNSAEREVLILLAHGHTAKSIAALTGRSVGTVNERLREARRKTGVGSSRELARRLLAREKSAEGIRVAAETVPGQAGGDGVSPVARPRTRPGMITASLLTAVVGAGALALQALESPAKDAAPRTAPIAQDEFARKFVLTEESPDPARLHAQLVAETRDAAWTPATEAALREIYGRVPNVGTRDDPLEIRCGATVCEVAAVFDVPQQRPGEPAPAALDKAASMLQSAELYRAVEAQGLTHVVTRFGPSRPTPKPMFLAFWLRKAG